MSEITQFQRNHISVLLLSNLIQHTKRQTNKTIVRWNMTFSDKYDKYDKSKYI